MLDTENHPIRDIAAGDGRHGNPSAVEKLAARLRALEELDYDALRAEWRRLSRAPPP